MKLPTTRISDQPTKYALESLKAKFPLGSQHVVGAGSAGTSLPAAPNNGDYYFYQADTTNGVVWMLRYNAASSSNYKWEFVGGPPMFAASDNARTTTSATYVSPATDPRSITAPRAGDYWITLEGRIRNGAGFNTALHSYEISAGAGASDTWAGRFFSAGDGEITTTARHRHAGMSASSVITEKIRSTDGVNTITVNQRRLLLLPIRLS